MIRERGSHFEPADGFSLIELLIVLVIAAILSAIAIPTMNSQRRLLRTSAMNREFLTQLRYARQLAMSERQAITFQYDDGTKAIKIIDHNNNTDVATSGVAILTAANYPMTTSAVVVNQVSLLQGGLPSYEVKWGIPPGLHGSPTKVDGITPLDITGSNNRLNITFQRDGSVVDSTANPVDQAVVLYNSVAPGATAAAITVRGSSGRVKIWRYNNVDAYVE